MHDIRYIFKRLRFALPAVLLAAPAVGQDFNIDCGGAATILPTDGYGAALSQPGRWTLVNTATTLLNLDGSPSSVFLAAPSAGSFAGSDACAGGEDALLFNDFKDPGNASYRFSGLLPGDYVIYTYAMATDDSTFRTDVSVQGSPDVLTTVGGDFCGGFVQGVTHAVHHVTTTDGFIFVNVAINSGFSTINGFQIQCIDCTSTTGTAVCFGDGSGAPCGCGNDASTGAGGCLNSLGVAALLSGVGNPDTTDDTVVLTATGVRAQPGLFFQGDNTIAGGSGATFGDGIRCCGMNVVRLEIVSPPLPQPSTATLTATITTKGPPGTIQPGDKKCYQYWYRDPGPANPCGSNFNFSNAFSIIWF